MKKNTAILIGFIAIQINIKAQSSYKSFTTKTPLVAVINMSDKDEDFDPKLMLIKAANPLPATTYHLNKQMLDAKHFESMQNYNGKSVNPLSKNVVPQPVQLKGFKANITQGTPNDNDIAVSNAGIVCSVVNTNMNILNDTGKVLSSRTLSSIAKGITNLNRTYDPRVIYDPEADRFIFVFMQGSTSKDTRIIVCFYRVQSISYYRASSIISKIRCSSK